MRRPLVAGNWKLNGTRASAVELASAVSAASIDLNLDLLICPSFTLIPSALSALEGGRVAVGSQTVSGHASGAFTGEVSAEMVVEAGCQFALVGHSERRSVFGEQDADIAAKVALALAAGLTPVVCVGESLEQRDAGAALDTVRAQLDGAFATTASAAIARCVLAYEPVWAIGTGLSASPDQAQDVHAAMRAWMAQRMGSADAETVRILYGGSVKPDNANALFSMRDIDGALVGGASLVANDFLAIARAAA